MKMHINTFSWLTWIIMGFLKYCVRVCIHRQKHSRCSVTMMTSRVYTKIFGSTVAFLFVNVGIHLCSRFLIHFPCLISPIPAPGLRLPVYKAFTSRAPVLPAAPTPVAEPKPSDIDVSDLGSRNYGVRTDFYCLVTEEDIWSTVLSHLVVSNLNKLLRCNTQVQKPYNYLCEVSRIRPNNVCLFLIVYVFNWVEVLKCCTISIDQFQIFLYLYILYHQSIFYCNLIV